MSQTLQPPGQTEWVHAASALVVAPHFDDEVLGCGGLLAQLTAAGAAVRVLFLSDGGGGTSEIPDRDAYRRRRREEAAQAGAALGLAGSDELDLPDGALDQYLQEIEQSLSRALLTLRPELLLVPSPLEVSRDHRAAFAAVHHLLATLRPGADPAGQPPWAGLRVLLYEVNHPAYPDLLVDVTAEAPRIEAAMACYASQEERHGYLGASLGLRRFRTLTLSAGSGIAGIAEGYRRLAVADFATRSPAQLVRHLGGVPELLAVHEGPRISVVVRTRDRPELLAEALASLAQGTYRKAEVVLVNDGGAPPAVPDGYPLPVIRVDLPESRGRAAAAQAGVEAAGGDYVAFLDDDDLAAPEHLATLAGLVGAAGVRVAYTDAAVGVYELDAGGPSSGWVCRERRLPYSRDFDPDLLLLDNYIPFNTLLIERRLLAEIGPLDPSLPFFEDWDLLIRLAARTPFHHLARVTCEYRHFRGAGHHIFGERPRERGDFLAVKERVLAKHAALLTHAALARAVDRLRFDVVETLESRDAARREAAELHRQLASRGEEIAALVRHLQGSRQELETLLAAHQALAAERFRFEELYHAANGNLDALQGDHRRQEEEIRRLYAEEGTLRAALAEQTAEVEKTYAEIERLNRLIRDMESTRAWRAHRWVERFKP